MPREVVPDSAVLSMTLTVTPSLVSQRASTSPVGSAPMIKTWMLWPLIFPLHRARPSWRMASVLGLTIAPVCSINLLISFSRAAQPQLGVVPHPKPRPD